MIDETGGVLDVVAVIGWEDTLAETLHAALEGSDVHPIAVENVAVTDSREDTQTLMAGVCDLVVSYPGESGETYLPNCRFEINHGRGPRGVIVGEIEVVITTGG